MKNRKFSEKLRSERERLGYSQQQVADVLNRTQSSYSRIESGVTKPSADELQEIVTKLQAIGFANLPLIQFEEEADTAAVRIKWPWNKNWLYALLVLLAILLLDYILQIPEEISQGFKDVEAGKPDPSPLKTLIAGLLSLSGIVYGLIWFIKRLLPKRS